MGINLYPQYWFVIMLDKKFPSSTLAFVYVILDCYTINFRLLCLIVTLYMYLSQLLCVFDARKKLLPSNTYVSF